jgi:tRNA-dihydrouridine synthase 1
MLPYIYRDAVNIPVFANGNILYHEDVERCIKETGVEGVMTAEGNLYNPAIFTPECHPIWLLADEYLEICKEHPTPSHIIRAHLFKLYKPCLGLYTDLREKLGGLQCMNEFLEISREFKERLQESEKKNPRPVNFLVNAEGIKNIPLYLCQPYIREISSPEEAERKKATDEVVSVVCHMCSSNVGSNRCPQKICRTCCLAKREECPAHSLKKSKRKIAQVLEP